MVKAVLANEDGFILTKWYVNGIYPLIWKFQLLGFILTKWYVNKVWDIVISATQRGFILTKWYVNINKVMKSDKGAFMFYIN